MSVVVTTYAVGALGEVTGVGRSLVTGGIRSIGVTFTTALGLVYGADETTGIDDAVDL